MPNRPDREVQCEGLLQALPPETEPVCDSRGDVKNKIFVCIRGTHHDGHADAAEVLRRGAAAIVTQRKTGLPREITVPDTRLAMALLSARYWGNPAGELRLIGITGTNGKTTTAHLLCHLLHSAGIKTGRIGTDGIYRGGRRLPNPYTTPPPDLLHRTLRQMAGDGITAVVMEVSSQALVQQRTAGLTFEAAVFTNLSPEHLDYHGDIERYFAAKAMLFTQCRRAVIHTGDPYGRRLAEQVTVPVTPYHLPWRYRCEAGRSILPWRGGQLIIPLTGEVFLPDALAAAETAVAMGVSPGQVMAAMPHAPSIPGRAELLWQGQGRTIMRDYAHTPDALERMLRSLRRVHGGRLLVLFGCGGDRDPMKRPIMGHIGVKLSDFAVITSDNPRTEDPMAIIEDILTGVKQEDGEYIIIEDRRAAIRYAMDIGKKDDIIILAGKGHETYQDIGGVKRHLDEREEVAAHLREKEETAWEN